MTFRYRGLPAELFSHLLGLSGQELETRAARRMIVDAKPGFPCRITLEDAEPGERVLLLPYEHQPAHSPFRASGPIFIRENARQSFDRAGPPPEVLATRILSVRAYSHDGVMVDAELVEGRSVEQSLARLLGGDATYAHIHFASRGCYTCRVEREE